MAVKRWFSFIYAYLTTYVFALCVYHAFSALTLLVGRQEGQIGFTFLVPAYLGSPGKRAIKRVCVCVCIMAEAFCDRLAVKFYF